MPLEEERSVEGTERGTVDQRGGGHYCRLNRREKNLHCIQSRTCDKGDTGEIKRGRSQRDRRSISGAQISRRDKRSHSRDRKT